MQVLPALNRQTLRALNAQGRRLSRRLAPCAAGCTPPAHPVDGTEGKTGLGKYSGITTALGVALKNDDLIRAAQTQGDAPPMLRRVSTLAAVIAMAATEKPRDQWYKIIAEITTFQTSNDVRALASKMPVREEDAIAYALTIVLLRGAIGERAGERGDCVLAYQKAMAALDGALESIRRREKTRVMAGPSRLAGLGSITEVASDTVLRTAYPAGWATWNDRELTRRGYREATGYDPQPVRLTAWRENNIKANRTYAEFVQIVRNDANDKRGVWFVGGPKECKESIKTGADWITEDCEVNATASGDTAARQKKIDMVRPAFKQATGLEPTNCDINYYTQLKWCTTGTYVDQIRQREAAGRPAVTQADKVRTFENTAAAQAVSQLTEAGKTGLAIIEAFLSGNISEGLGLVVKVLGDIGKTAAQFLCSAITLIFRGADGQATPAGQVLCAIITFLISGIFNSMRNGAAISKAIFDGLGNLFRELGQGNFKNAANVLLNTTNNIVLILLAGDFTIVLGLPLVDQELTADQRAKGYKSIETLSKELGFDFTLGLVAAGAGMIFGGPTPNNVSSIIMAISPAVALVLAPVLKNDPRSPESIRVAPLETIKKGILALVKIGALVTVRVMNNEDVLLKFGLAVQRYINRIRSNAPAELQKLKDSLSKNFGKQWDEFKLKMANGNFDEKVAAIKNLTAFIPDLLVAIAMDDPDLAQAYATGKILWDEGKKTYEEAKKIWEDAMKAEPTDAAKIKVLRDSINTARAQLDVLCQKVPDDPNCKFPSTVVEKIVPVEKIVEKQVIVYRDPPAGTMQSSTQRSVAAPTSSNTGLIFGGLALAGIAVAVASRRA
jgi:hypothetical protein